MRGGHSGGKVVQRRGLTPRQQRLVAEYLVDLNATQASIRAGYSTKTAASIGHENLRKPEISAAVQATVQRHLAKLDLSLERIVQEAARVGISDIGDLFDADGHVIPTHLLPRDIRKAISGIKVQHIKVDVEVQEDGERVTTITATTQTTEFKFWDKLRGLELVGKTQGPDEAPGRARGWRHLGKGAHQNDRATESRRESCRRAGRAGSLTRHVTQSTNATH